MKTHLLILEGRNEFNPERLEELVQNRITNGEFGYNPEKTRRGMFLVQLITHAEGRHMGVELAYTYGLIIKEQVDHYYKMPSADDQEAYNKKCEIKAKKLEKLLGNELTKKTNLNGKFFFGWEDADPDVFDELFYGLCYSEDIVPVNN